MNTMVKKITVILETETYDWLATRAKSNNRSRLREARTIIEAERKRDARNKEPGPLNAQA